MPRSAGAWRDVWSRAAVRVACSGGPPWAAGSSRLPEACASGWSPRSSTACEKLSSTLPNRSRPSSSGGELTQAKSVLKELCKHKDAAVFLEPVDWKTLELHDYPLLVKKPMDLGTVQKRLNAGGYASMMDVAADVNLVWSNAMTYNQDGSPIDQLAAALKAVADRKMAPLLAAAGEAAPEVTFITFEMKKKLQEGAATLPGKDLYGMVMIVEDSCKRAIDQSNAQELELDIDSLDLPTFLKLDKYVQDSLARARKK